MSARHTSLFIDPSRRFDNCALTAELILTKEAKTPPPCPECGNREETGMELAQVWRTQDVIAAPIVTNVTGKLARSESEDPARNVRELWSDGELTSAVISRNEFAFSELFRRHYVAVVSCSRMILANVAQSEDIGADVLLDFWLRPHTFDASRGTLRTFLRLKARGRSIDLIRAETRRMHRERHEADRLKVLESGFEMNVLSRDLQFQMREALANLPIDEREPIELAFFGGLTYIAVAQHLGLPEGTTKARIRSGLIRLRSVCLVNEISSER